MEDAVPAEQPAPIQQPTPAGLTVTPAFTWIALIALIATMVLWLAFTPNGILGKADAVGYAVCHRIEARSFLFPNGRQLPMCARCSGQFLGVLVGLLGPGLILRRRRAANYPPTLIVVIMLLFTAFWAFDGSNSFLHLLPYENLPRLYSPSNFLRVFSGMWHGITMGSILLPIVNASLWADATHERTIDNLWHYAILLGVGAVIILMVLSGLAVFLYPLAVLSAIGALSVLAAASTVLIASILDQENRARTLREALPLIMFGMAAAVAVIGLIDAFRFSMFGTWEGIEPLVDLAHSIL